MSIKIRRRDWRYVFFMLALLVGMGLVITTDVSAMRANLVGDGKQQATAPQVKTGPSVMPAGGGCTPNYIYTIGSDTIVPGTTDIGNHGDDRVTEIILPFWFQLYDQSFITVTVSSNGNLQFIGSNTTYNNTCLSAPDFSYTIFPHWDDLRTDVGLTGCSVYPSGCGVFITTTGSEPNRVFIIEWRTIHCCDPNNTLAANFEVKLYEDLPSAFDIVYGQVDLAGTGATVGVQRDSTSHAQYTCNTGSLHQGLLLGWTLEPCGTPTPTFTPCPICPTPTNTPTRPIPPSHTDTPTRTITPTPLPTQCGTNYSYITGTNTLIPGTDDIGNHCDDCVTTINLPFSFQLYDHTSITANVSSNGNLQFVGNNTAFNNSCLSAPGFNYTIFPYWDDLRTDANADCSVYPSGCGIFVTTTGSAPNRVFIIEWRTHYFEQGIGAANFEVRLYEGAPDRFDFVYGEVDAGGFLATVGVQQDAITSAQYECITGNVTRGLKIGWTLEPCGTPPPTLTPCPTCPTSTNTPTRVPTNTHTITPTALPTQCGTDHYSYTTGMDTIVPGDEDTGNHGDDIVTQINLPFSFQLYGQDFTTASVGANGNLQFIGSNTTYENNCLAAPGFNYTIFPYWDDLVTSIGPTPCPQYPGGCGIFTSVSGSAPNRILNIEWRTVYFNNQSQQANFEVRLYEGLPSRFDIIYGQVDQAGISATVSVQKDMASYTEYECNAGGLTQGLKISWILEPCSTPTPTGTPALMGHATWDHRDPQPDPSQALPISLTLRLKTGGSYVDYHVQNTDEYGRFTVSVNGLPSGDYFWRAKGPMFLANSGSVTLTGDMMTEVEMGMMKVGDANDDNSINVADFNILKGTFGWGCGNAGYDDRADFNSDCSVNIRDFNLLKENFGMTGAPQIQP